MIDIYMCINRQTVVFTVSSISSSAKWGTLSLALASSTVPNVVRQAWYNFDSLYRNIIYWEHRNAFISRTAFSKQISRNNGRFRLVNFTNALLTHTSCCYNKAVTFIYVHTILCLWLLWTFDIYQNFSKLTFKNQYHFMKCDIRITVEDFRNKT